MIGASSAPSGRTPIRVEHVHVGGGGQAVIGNVNASSHSDSNISGARKGSRKRAQTCYRRTSATTDFFRYDTAETLSRLTATPSWASSISRVASKLLVAGVTLLTDMWGWLFTEVGSHGDFERVDLTTHQDAEGAGLLSRSRGPGNIRWPGVGGRGGPITSLAEDGCPDLGPFHGSGCGAKLICNRLARLAKTVRLRAPLIAAVRCHSPSSRTKQVHLQLERASPAAQPTSPRHKRSRFSSIGSPEAGGRYPRRSTRNRPTGNNQAGSPDCRSGCRVGCGTDN
jgi:hypothetical protein